jgi:hypothetical protein
LFFDGVGSIPIVSHKAFLVEERVEVLSEKVSCDRTLLDGMRHRVSFKDRDRMTSVLANI